MVEQKIMWYKKYMDLLKSLYMECRIPGKNKHAFYRIMMARDLFGLIIICQWGRIGTKGRRLIKRFNDASAAMREFSRIIRLRCRHEYRIIENVRDN